MSLGRPTPASIDPLTRAMTDVFGSMERDLIAPWGWAARFPAPRTATASAISGFGDGAGSFNMHLDFHETENGFEMTADLPGMKKEDITVDVDNESHVLTVSGERKNEKEEKSEDKDGEKKYHFVERSYGRTTRSIRLPETADTAKANAGYADGVLTLTFPKREPPAAARRLKISVGDGGGQKASIEGGAPAAGGDMES